MNKIIIYLLSLLPELWLEKALRRKPDIFSVAVLKGKEIDAMMKTISLYEAENRQIESNGNIH